MAFVFHDYLEYVKEIVDGESIKLGSPINIDYQSSEIGFTYRKKTNTIFLGQNSLTCILLYSTYRLSPKRIRRLLFLYFLAYSNLSKYKLDSSLFLFQKICKEMDKQWMHLNGLANSIYLNEIISFQIGHETAHACFKADEEFKKRIIDRIKENFPTTGDAKSMREKYAFGFVPESISDNELEEFACDYISLKYLFTRIRYENYTTDEVKELIVQILNIVLMQMYSSNFGTMEKFKLLKKGVSMHVRKHIVCLFRLGLATASIQEFIDNKYAFDYKSFFDEQMRLSKKLLDGIWRMDFSSQLTLISLVRSPEVANTTDFYRINEYKKIFSNISEEIQNILFGKVEE